MRFAVFLAAGVLLAAPALASTWQVEPAQGQITFSASQSGQPFEGTLPALNAEIIFDPADLAQARVKAVMPLTGVSTGAAMRDSELPKPDWLDLASHPEATFESNAFRTASAEETEAVRKAWGEAIDLNAQRSGAAYTYYTADGTLTLRGISQKLSLPFALAIQDGKAAMFGAASFNRMPFEVGKNWPEGSGVSENVTVKVALTASEAPVVPVPAPAPAAE